MTSILCAIIILITIAYIFGYKRNNYHRVSGDLFLSSKQTVKIILIGAFSYPIAIVAPLCPTSNSEDIGPGLFYFILAIPFVMYYIHLRNFFVSLDSKYIIWRNRSTINKAGYWEIKLIKTITDIANGKYTFIIIYFINGQKLKLGDEFSLDEIDTFVNKTIKYTENYQIEIQKQYKSYED